MIFETERLKVRLLEPSDLNAFHEMESNPNVMRFTGTPPKNRTENQVDLQHCMTCYQKPSNNFWVWAIERKSDQAFVGTCAIVKSDPRQNHPEKHEIGFRFLEKYWGKGYGKEIVPRLIQYAFEDMNIKELIAEVDEKNTASVRILDHFLEHIDTYFNERDQSMDRLYTILKK
jgi:RimJ/RimL family protein N-acetyltransferase